MYRVALESVWAKLNLCVIFPSCEPGDFMHPWKHHLQPSRHAFDCPPTALALHQHFSTKLYQHHTRSGAKAKKCHKKFNCMMNKQNRAAQKQSPPTCITVAWLRKMRDKIDERRAKTGETFKIQLLIWKQRRSANKSASSRNQANRKMSFVMRTSAASSALHNSAKC